MEDNGGSGFGRGRNTNRSLGKGRGRGRGKRNSTMTTPPSTRESTLPSTTHVAPRHCQPTADSTSSHDPLVGQSTPPSTTHSTANHSVVPSEDIGTLRADGRMLIRPAPSNEFEPSSMVRDIMTIIKSKFVGSWLSYAKANKHDKDLTDMWFNEFKRQYRWLPEHDIQIRKSFDHKASTGLADTLYRVRTKKDSGTWIPEQNRKEMEQKWKEDDWKRNAANNANNRNSSSGPLHTGGSIPSSEHFRRLIVIFRIEYGKG
ncbi:uncharacterized protein LOC130744256 [Lotus japonicus]|uniref:uncharacterized protein LOC130744256 n=1 Tax=Lotus japonicus TaxID=34305 RepID=UPI00258C8FC0|nr:uncharacterized protein LOC130744256 [Lotus japonicus]